MSQPHIPNNLFSFIWIFLREYKFVVFVCVFLCVIAGFWGPFNSILIKNLIDTLTSENKDISFLYIPALMIVLNFIIFDNVTWRGINYIWAKYIPTIQNDIVLKVLDHTLSHSYDFYQRSLSGQISKQIINLVEGISKIISTSSANFLRGFSLLTISIVTAFFVYPVFGLILLIWFICFSAVSLLLSKKLVYLSDELALKESSVVGEIVDSISNHHNVKIFSQKKYEILRMKPFLLSQKKSHTKNHIYSNLLACIQGGLIALMMAFSTCSLIYLYGKGLVTVGEVALILGLSMETGHMMWFTMSQVDEFNQAVGRCKQSLKTLLIPIQIVDLPKAKVLKCTSGAITFDRVKFSYKEQEPLFEENSIEIPAGQRVGLVGYSGGGKSSFVNLILRLYDVNDGSICIDGQNIKEVTQESLRQNIAMIPQDPILFQRSLMENIRYGRIDATDEEVIDAARKAEAHDFIEKQPQGYETLVGEKGIKLSGGQRQRIAIARAILKKAPILILDEATSQLDSINECLIQNSLWELIQGKTSIVIAHRLSTLLNMDRILVFDKGRIIEDGTHHQLLRLNGLYKKLWDSQVGGFLDGERIF